MKLFVCLWNIFFIGIPKIFRLALVPKVPFCLCVHLQRLNLLNIAELHGIINIFFSFASASGMCLRRHHLAPRRRNNRRPRRSPARQRPPAVVPRPLATPYPTSELSVSRQRHRCRSISLWLKAMHAQVKRRLPGQRQHPLRPPAPPPASGDWRTDVTGRFNPTPGRDVLISRGGRVSGPGTSEFRNWRDFKSVVGQTNMCQNWWLNYVVPLWCSGSWSNI